MRIHLAEAGLTEVPAGDDWLGEAERERLAGLTVPKRRADWRLGRWAAKHAIAACLGPARRLPLASIQIIAAEDGAPEVVIDGSGGSPAVRVSISHSGGRALCAAARTVAALGCDTEGIELRDRAFLADYLTLAERALVDCAREAERTLATNLVWSAKESALKALRTGLRRDTRSVEVRFGIEALRTAGWAPLEVLCLESGRAYHGWWRREARYVQTIITDPPAGQHHLRFRRAAAPRPR